jgi:hypothetical protein
MTGQVTEDWSHGLSWRRNSEPSWRITIRRYILRWLIDNLSFDEKNAPWRSLETAVFRHLNQTLWYLLLKRSNFDQSETMSNLVRNLTLRHRSKLMVSCNVNCRRTALFVWRQSQYPITWQANNQVEYIKSSFSPWSDTWSNWHSHGIFYLMMNVVDIVRENSW